MPLPRSSGQGGVRAWLPPSAPCMQSRTTTAVPVLWATGQVHVPLPAAPAPPRAALFTELTAPPTVVSPLPLPDALAAPPAPPSAAPAATSNNWPACVATPRKSVMAVVVPAGMPAAQWSAALDEQRTRNRANFSSASDHSSASHHSSCSSKYSVHASGNTATMAPPPTQAAPSGVPTAPLAASELPTISPSGWLHIEQQKSTEELGGHLIDTEGIEVSRTSIRKGR